MAHQSGSEDTLNKLATMPSTSSKKSAPANNVVVVEEIDEKVPLVSQKKNLLEKAVM